MGIQGPSNRFSRKFKAVCVGNVVEYYEWVTFSAFADVFGREFFEQSRDTSEAENLLLGLSVFAAGFLMRPLGGIVFGYIGDRYSRERALELSVLCMVLPSTILIFLPTFKTAGIFASIALVIVRLLQGLACGGEMVGAFVHTMETAEGVYVKKNFIVMNLLLCHSEGNGPNPSLHHTYSLRHTHTHTHTHIHTHTRQDLLGFGAGWSRARPPWEPRSAC